MSDFNRGLGPVVQADADVDVGLRRFMLGVYNKMALGLLLSAVLAYAITNVGPVADLFYRLGPDGQLRGLTIYGIALQFAPLVVILASNFIMREPTARGASFLYWSIVTLIGAGSSILVLRYTGASIGTTFLLTATAFGALSLVGYTIKRDLSGFHSFLIMGVWILVGASILSMFVSIPGSSLILNIVGGFLFAGLIATQTQMLKMTYYQVQGDGERMSALTSLGALNLYIAFMNLFHILLSLFGVRR
jgi:FtsH-binding integral membrane protein